MRCGYVSIHAARGDFPLVHIGGVVSIHAPTRGATDIGQGMTIRCNVSIHAPTRGATIAAAVARLHKGTVSIHAPTRGATRHSSVTELLPARFRSTPTTRGATGLVECLVVNDVVSIHAPTRGATKIDLNQDTTQMFRSTPPREGRPSLEALFQLGSKFRSTPPREGRHVSPSP